MTADQTFALEVAKYASRVNYGIIRTKPDYDDRLFLMNKQMILQVLGDSACLEELTADEQTELTGILSLHSEFYG
jgi:hypothetical protein